MSTATTICKQREYLITEQSNLNTACAIEAAGSFKVTNQHGLKIQHAFSHRYDQQKLVEFLPLTQFTRK
jgi:hypothetical protein